MYQIIYYILLSSNIALYFILLKKFKISLFSYSTISYIFAIFFAMLPGYGIANGDIGYFYDGQGMILNLYLIYLLFIVITTFCLLLGQIAGNNRVIKLSFRKHLKSRISYMTIGIIIYSIIYLLWLPSIPLNYLLLGGSEIQSSLMRLEITHGLKNSEVPFLFRYWRNFLQLFLPCLVLFYIFNKKTPVFVRVTLFFFQLYLLIFTLEKAVAMYFFIAIILFSIINVEKIEFLNRIRNVIKLRYILIIIIAIMTLIFSYTEFMGSTTPLQSIYERVGKQTGSTRLMLEYVESGGFIGIKGLDMPIIKHLIDYEYINLSQKAIIELYPNRNSDEIAGAAGGLSLAQLYFMFSWWGLFLFAGAILTVGFLDRIFFKTIFSLPKSDQRLLLMSFYCTFAGFNALSLTSSIFNWFSFPIFFSPELILFLIFVSVFIKWNDSNKI